ncbi:MAG TPA: endolytic transglycosylase MltG [Bacillota bacterium]|nr:endolytic transglycosylase MltG [Bacillota bacterium]HPA55393.1 endolytic transglycosylase MltG [Bacillota bacterium]HPX68707.1 endolytic transglycosylase MltG [Bacillota bacterium]HQA64687.1 endolytic transglycosylase MltG [Bacillota bacterium]HQO42022.1 endolytic transglycosylase MltG [Bacillota bacterium]
MKAKLKFNIFRFLVFCSLLALVLAYVYYNNGMEAVSGEGSDFKEIVIPKGSTIRYISKILKEEDLIKDSLIFELYCKINEKADKIKAGRYSISSSMKVSEIVDVLVSGKALIDTVKFTIPEGYNLAQIAERISSLGVVSPESIQAALKAEGYEYEFIEQIPDRENKLEGYLFPDTYEIYRDTTAEAIIKKLLGRFDDIFTEKFRSRAEELNMSIDQVVTLASIIEREAKLDSERKTISGVFHNRLKKKMLLQSCATVQYLLKEPKEELLYEDLEIDSPYNTYKYAGLPPGPIASPGLAAIEAALYPENTDFLYFFALEDGSHVFTKTYNEHINTQNKYRK